MTLSLRAQEAAKPGDMATFIEVLGNPWSEQTPSGYVNLGVAENTLAHDDLIKHIPENLVLKSEHFTYGNGTNGSIILRETLAKFLTKHLAPLEPLDKSHITVTNGCSSAIEHLSWAFANPGEAFLLGQPYYGTFTGDITFRVGAKVVPVPFHGMDPFSLGAVDKYEEALIAAMQQGVKTAGLILCSPHNPLGRCYSPEVLTKFMLLCQKYRIQLISDEIYALSTWENTIDKDVEQTPFRSCLSIPVPPGFEPSRLTVLWGMSKDFGANGIRIGAVISQHNEMLHKALIPASPYSSASSLSEHATINILSDEIWVEEYVAKNKQNLKKHHEIAVEWAKSNNIPYKPGVNAAFFLWVDLGAVYKAKDDQDITEAINQKLLAKRVFLASGTSFGSEYPGWFRIVFTNRLELLNEGLKRVLEAVRE